MKRLLFTLSMFAVTAYMAQDTYETNNRKMNEVHSLINRMYVDDVPNDEISDAAIRAMLEKLDPHSTYIPSDEVQSANERIVGSFVGIGIRYQIVNDTLLVVNPIPGGPSEKLGIRAGDKIVQIEDEVITGIGIKNSGVRDRLLGEKGSKVKVYVYRPGQKQLQQYTITRDNIPLNSVVSHYMVDNQVGFIKLTNFSRSTGEEVKKAIKDLKKQGMKDLIFDLQGNGGGLLQAAKYVADEFLDDDKLIVYSEGRKQPKSVLVADEKGEFEKGRLVILIDEGSASASEILAGAIQDWDRGVIVGRRSFGKGLVQRPLTLSDGSEIRLTISRYYTPTGRNIQKPYDDIEMYKNDYYQRYLNGEMMSKDSINLPDSLRFETKVKGRTVYGGGGIMPDLFVPLDTLEYSDYYKKLSRSGVFNDFAIRYVEKHRDAIKSNYKTIHDFKKSFGEREKLMEEFIAFAEDKDTTLTFVEEDFNISKDLIDIRLKAVIASSVWDYSAFYEVFNVKNEIFMAAYALLSQNKYEEVYLSEVIKKK
jgi:carboxyl-terminal processing protease